MKKLFLMCTVLLAAVPTLAHEPSLSKETLQQLFPEAENFANRQMALTPDQVLQVEQTAQDKLQEVDKNLTLFVAIAKDPQTNRMRSLGAILMVDAAGSKGPIDMAVAYNLDGSVKKVLVTANKDDRELETEAFLGQLEGKGPSDSWNEKQDFQLVGNPASAQAVIRAVRRGMHLFLAFMKR